LEDEGHVHLTSALTELGVMVVLMIRGTVQRNIALDWSNDCGGADEPDLGGATGSMSGN